MRSSFFTLFLTVLLSVGCASRQPKEPPLVGPHLPPGHPVGPMVGPPDPPKPPEVKPPDAGVRPVEKVHVALALGGAGVASFATVGLIKRLHEEGVIIDYIVATGWPALFALGYGFKDSIHNFEFFAMKIGQKDFYKTGLFDLGNDAAKQDQLSETIDREFRQREFSDSKLPVVISALNTDLAQPERFDRGEWKDALLKTMSVPGIFRPYPKNDVEWASSLSGIDVDEALRRGAKHVIAVEMYGDYFKQLSDNRKDAGDKAFRKIYLGQLKASLKREMKLTPFAADIVLNRPPNDFSAKRAAIQAGYREAARLLRQLRTSLN